MMKARNTPSSSAACFSRVAMGSLIESSERSLPRAGCSANFPPRGGYAFGRPLDVIETCLRVRRPKGEPMADRPRLQLARGRQAADAGPTLQHEHALEQREPERRVAFEPETETQEPGGQVA